MTSYEIHRPSFSGTSKEEWEFPTENELETDDLSATAEHFLLSWSGFDDPESFDDLELPVVTPHGELSLNGLWAARSGPYSVERVEDIDAETKKRVRELIEDLGDENFDVFGDVTVTESEWAETAERTSADPSSGFVERIATSQPTYSPDHAVVGLLFLVCVSAVLTGDHDG